MQSFKQYLLKEDTTSSNPYIEILTGVFAPDVAQIEREKGNEWSEKAFEQKASAYLREHFTNNETKVYFDGGGELIIIVELGNDNSNLSHFHIKNTSKAILKITDDLLDTKLENRNIDNFFLTFRRELGPNVKTDWPYIQFDFSESPSLISLEQINQKIPDCKILIFNHSVREIKSNVLGLLKIKSLKEIKIYDVKTTPWFDIIEKHFNGDKDMIKCQRELIENDLDEYAEL